MLDMNDVVFLIFCFVYCVIGVLQEKWVLYIVCVLLGSEKGFNELVCVVGGCNSVILMQCLESLEDLGIIVKCIEDGGGKFVCSVYLLIFVGQEFQIVIDVIDVWVCVYFSEFELMCCVG